VLLLNSGVDGGQANPGAEFIVTQTEKSFLELASASMSAVTMRYTTKSAMTPIFWACTAIFPTGIGGAWLFRDTASICWVLTSIAILPVLVFCGVYIYFVLRDPDRLHSEDHRLRTKALDLFESKGGKIKADPMNLVALMNPYPDENVLPHKVQNQQDDQKPGVPPHA
jgi:hypothetical protein